MPKIKEEFWAVIFRYEPFHFGPSPTARYSGTMFFPYRYKVTGISIKNIKPDRRMTADGAWTNYDLFAYRLNGRWRLHEKTTGVIISEGRTIDDAMKKFQIDLSILSTERKHRRDLKSFEEQIADLGPAMGRPEMTSEDAFRIIVRQEEEKKTARRMKKEMKLQLEASIEKRSIEPFEPRD